MLDPKNIENIIKQIMETMPEGVRALPQDLRNNLQLALQGVLSKLDLVTREEFDTQVAVLRRTRQKLDELELTLEKLNSKDES